jgi:hypothetical protein
MREELGFAAIHGLFAVPGLALLHALGFVRRPIHVLTALGPAYICGLAAVLPVLILMLVLGIPAATLPAAVATALVIATAVLVAGFVARRRGVAATHPEPARPASRLEAWIGRAGVLALGLYFAFGTSAFKRLGTLGDDWQMWSYKAVAFFHYGRLQHEVFGVSQPGPAHPDYPVLKPLLDSLLYRAIGGEHLDHMHMFLWLLFGALVWTLGYFVRARGFALALILPVVAALALSPAAHDITRIGYVDITVAGFGAAGALCIGLWLEEGGMRFAIVGSLLLAAAANTKNEGLIAAFVVLLAAAFVIWRFGERPWRAWLTAAGIVLAGTLPWLIFKSTHHLSNSDVYPLTHSLNPGFLLDRTGRLTFSMAKTMLQLSDQTRWVWVTPLFFILAGACVVTGTVRRVATYYLMVALLTLASLWWVYWTGRLEIQNWVFYSVDRVVAGVVLLAGAGLLHLTGLLVPWGRRAPEAEAPAD